MTGTATVSPLPDWTTKALLDALMKHYRKPGTPRDGCVLITEAESPGKAMRRCDLIHIGVMSRGGGIDGHELKISRADWLRELHDPTKADAWWPYCTRWWVVAPPGIVQDGELPEGWGLMEPPPRGRRFRIKTYATAKEPNLTVGLVAELLRQSDNERLRAVQQADARHRDDLHRQAEKIRAEQDRRGLDFVTRQRLDLLEMVEKAIGVPIDEYAWRDPSKFDRIRPEELAAALEHVPGHVQAQRLLSKAEGIRGDLRAACTRVMAQLRDPQ